MRQRTFQVSVTFLNVFCITSVDWSETPKISLIVLEWGQNWLKIRDDKDRRSCFLVKRGGLWSICLLSTPADVAAGQLINPSQLLERKTSYPRQYDPPVCIYGDQFHRKISSSPLLEVRKINSGRGAACKSQSRRCNIQTHKQGYAFIFKFK